MNVYVVVFVDGGGEVYVNVLVIVCVVVLTGMEVFPSMSGPPKYACAFPFMFKNVGSTVPFGKEDVVPHISWPCLSVTAAAVIILTVL